MADQNNAGSAGNRRQCYQGPFRLPNDKLHKAAGGDVYGIAGEVRLVRREVVPVEAEQVVDGVLAVGPRGAEQEQCGGVDGGGN